MTFIKISYIFALFVFSSTVAAQGAQGRDLIVQKTMNCLSEQWHQNAGIDWNDVCNVSGSASQQKLQAVNQQMDQIEGNVTPQNATPPGFSHQDWISEEVPPNARGGKVAPQDTTLQNAASQNATLQDTKQKNVMPSPTAHHNWLSEQVPPGITDPDLYHKRKFDLAYQTEFHKYQTGNKWPYFYSQTYTVSDKEKENGTLNGLYGSTSWWGPLHTWSDLLSMNEMPNFGRLEAEISKGRIDYWSNVTGKIKGKDSWDFDARILIGWDHIVNNNTDITPYFGAGFQRFVDKNGGWEDWLIEHYVQYPIVTYMIYLPIGVETHTKLNEQWDVNFKLEGDVYIYGQSAYHLHDASGPFLMQDVNTGIIHQVIPSITDAPLNGGYGFRTSFKLIKKYKYCDFYIEPFFKYFFLNKSNAVQEKASITDSGSQYVSVYPDKSPYKALWTAKNSTINVGARAGIEF